jgi:hypothetical protein
MKKLLITAALALGLVSIVSAQSPQYRTTHATNATVTCHAANVVSTNLTIFTAATSRTYNQVTIQNVSTNAVYLKWGAVTGATNALTTGLYLAPQGTVGDKAVYNIVLPQTVTISGQSKETHGGGVVNIEALGR